MAAAEQLGTGIAAMLGGPAEAISAELARVADAQRALLREAEAENALAGTHSEEVTAVLELLREVEARQHQLAGVTARMEQALVDTGKQKARVAMLVQRKMESDHKAAAKRASKKAKDTGL